MYKWPHRGKKSPATPKVSKPSGNLISEEVAQKIFELPDAQQHQKIEELSASLTTEVRSQFCDELRSWRAWLIQERKVTAYKPESNPRDLQQLAEGANNSSGSSIITG